MAAHSDQRTVARAGDRGLIATRTQGPRIGTYRNITERLAQTGGGFRYSVRFCHVLSGVGWQS